MTVPGNLSSPLLATAAAAAAAPVEGPIKSVRFNHSDSAYLERNFGSTGNQRTFTISLWFKNTLDSNGQRTFFTAQENSPLKDKFTKLWLSSNHTLHFDERDGGSDIWELNSDVVFRDPSAWYHLVARVDTTQSTPADRVRLYVNNIQIEDFSSAVYPGQNALVKFVNVNNAKNFIGRYLDNSYEYLDAYVADYYFIDGLSLGPTSFGAYDDNGVWQAAVYSGTYGTNGFHLLDFANESTVGHDSSGNENDFSATGLSTTAGAGNDVLFDVPTNNTQSDSGAGGEKSGNYCVMNPLIVNQTNAITSNGNLHVKYPNTEDTWVGNIQGTNYITFVGTMGLTSGKWYFEAVETVRETSTESMVVGVVDTPMGGVYYVGSVGNGIGYRRTDVRNGLGASQVTTTSMPDFSVGDVIGVALDLDNGKIYFSKNGTYINSGNPAAGTGFLASGLSGTFFPAISRWSKRHSIEADLNFGQRPFNTSAPSGFKAICTANLEPPTIADGSDYFETAIWDGDSASSRTIPTSFDPDFVWVKNKSVTGRSHYLYDVVRGFGANKELVTNAKVIEGSTAHSTQNHGYVSGTTSTGFTLAAGATNSNYTNQSGQSYVGWAWEAGSSTVDNTDGTITSQVRASQSSGFSIVSFTGTGVNSSIGHGLNAVPEFIMMKDREATTGWPIWGPGFAAEEWISFFTLTKNSTDGANYFPSAPTSSVVNLGPWTSPNGNDMIAYCFAPVAGFSEMGEFDATQPFVYLGFAPKFLMLKDIDVAEDWCIYDSRRVPYNPNDTRLEPNTSDDEVSASTIEIDFLSNGFKVVGGGSTINGHVIYIAFASHPFQANGGLAR